MLPKPTLHFWNLGIFMSENAVDNFYFLCKNSTMKRKVRSRLKTRSIVNSDVERFFFDENVIQSVDSLIKDYFWKMYEGFLWPRIMNLTLAGWNSIWLRFLRLMKTCIFVVLFFRTFISNSTSKKQKQVLLPGNYA